jgi:2-dehydro-3-deoxygluconokinase
MTRDDAPPGVPLLKLAAIGECMVELSRRTGDEGAYDRRFGGDTLNTATYLARLTGGMARVSYVTRLGDDSLSGAMIASWQDEGIDCSLSPRMTGRLPGLYMIETSPAGERSFLYWRQNAPAREILDGDCDALLAALMGMDVVYFSGITVAILRDHGRQVLTDLLRDRQARGLANVFDSNYRKSLWQDAPEARRWMEAVMTHCSLLLISSEDMVAIHGEEAPAGDWIDRLARLGPADIVVKDGGFNVHTQANGVRGHFRLAHDDHPVDTTGAGDSFNAGFLAATLRRQSTAEAVAAGHRLASRVIRHRGAIIARKDMP